MILSLIGYDVRFYNQAFKKMIKYLFLDERIN